jgi:protein gp37
MTTTPSTNLIKYDAACRALAEAVAVDEVMAIHDQAAQLAACAHIAKNHKAEADAIALRMRATRRLGQLMQAQKNSVGFNRGAAAGGKKDGSRGVLITPRDLRPTLASQGIDKNLAKEARALSAPSEQDFEQKIAEVHDAVTSAVTKVVKSIALPEKERDTAASADEVEITLKQWKSMSPAERREAVDPKNFPSDVKFNRQDSDGIDWAQNSWNPIVGCKHPCEILCWAHDITLRFPGRYPHGFNPVFRPRMLNAPRNTPVPPEAAFDGRYKNVFTVSMGDMFGGWVPPEWIEAILAVERANPQWNFLHLTKFPQRLIKFDLPLNTWIGTTVDWQARVPNAEEAFAKLREKYPDIILFASVEPMLEPIQFKRLDLFNLIIIGGAAQSMRTPEWRPPHRWIMDLIAQADAVGRKVFEKTNLHGNRILELPFDPPIKNDYPQVAPDVFRYLGKNKSVAL